jgi:predicted O-linked N-acetylglucosamine transferase (SPINDLY family)
VQRDRIRLITWLEEYGPHFSDYDQIDIALDSTPYAGTTTTCEAMWMGVPVVTLLADQPANRVGASLLTQVGHPEWMANTDQEFVRIASDLASDVQSLDHLRQNLR